MWSNRPEIARYRPIVVVVPQPCPVTLDALAPAAAASPLRMTRSQTSAPWRSPWPEGPPPDRAFATAAFPCRPIIRLAKQSTSRSEMFTVPRQIAMPRQRDHLGQNVGSYALACTSFASDDRPPATATRGRNISHSLPNCLVQLRERSQAKTGAAVQASSGHQSVRAHFPHAPCRTS
jgi:hypothetical protein